MTEKPTEAQVEAAAREMFYMSYGGRMGLWHWPGDEPRLIKDGEDPYWLGRKTIPADDRSAPGEGKKPDELREIARRMLAAALSIE